MNINTERDIAAPVSAMPALCAMVKAVSIPTALLNIHGRILAINPAFASTLGYVVDDLCNRFIFELLDEDAEADMHALLEQGGQKPMSLQCADFARTRLHLSFRLLPRDCAPASCLLHAPTKETGLRDSLSQMPRENPNPVLSIDSSGRLFYANEAGQALLTHWRCAVGDVVPQHIKALAVATINDGVARQIDEHCEREVFELRFHSSHGRVSLYGLDVSARIEAESALTEALHKVKALQNKLLAENDYLREEIRQNLQFGELIGSDRLMREVAERIERVADTDSTVLIFGETGTGKELIARALHSNSRRKHRSLVKVNCAALPPTLIESELFGHERGAFTSANQRRAGRFELADSGTLFLDEVGELPLEIQAKLLRVLQEGEFERLGGNHSLKVDVRVIAATNRHLEELVLAGEFREDLYYRLNVFPIKAPALRERRADIPELVEHFLRKYQEKIGRLVRPLEPKALTRLSDYDWPGNVRELENLIERAVILSTDGIVQIDENLFSNSRLKSRPTKIQDVEAEMIRKALRASGGTIEGHRGAARQLGLAPSTLRERMRRYDIPRKIGDT